MMEEMDIDKLEIIKRKQRLRRAEINSRILESTCTKRIFVSGPGTGKTYMFREILKTKSGDCLVLTFIRNLAKKLESDLDGQAKVCTFHSFCMGLLHRIKKNDLSQGFALFPGLEMIIGSDAMILDNENPKFMRSFRDIDLSGGDIEFFLKRSSYYDAVSFDDSVYRVMEYLKHNSDQVPSYEQILVDEYQDFNKLEVELINILGQKSPILIVGDDDQALYGKLKNASAKHIRERFNDPKYESFCLPFCSRCTSVITGAISDVIVSARKMDRLTERISKEYVCYFPDKWEDSRKYPKIVCVSCSVQRKKAPYMARFIEQEIDQLSIEEIRAANQKADHTILVAGSGHYLRQVQDYFRKLKNKYRLFFRREESYSEVVKILQGYSDLLERGNSSNLGWRILLKFDKLESMRTVLSRTARDPNVNLYRILPNSYVKKHMNILDILDKLKQEEGLETSESEKLEKAIGMNVQNIKKKLYEKDEEKDDVVVDTKSDEISVVFSTYVGCKGLSTGYTFILGLDEGNLPRNNHAPTNIEICQFIVALARTVKKCYLICTAVFLGEKQCPSAFIDWIDQGRLEFVKVDKQYWERGRHTNPCRTY